MNIKLKILLSFLCVLPKERMERMETASGVAVEYMEFLSSTDPILSSIS